MCMDDEKDIFRLFDMCLNACEFLLKLLFGHRRKAALDTYSLLLIICQKSTKGVLVKSEK